MPQGKEQPLLITEIFHSLQGETTLSGIRFAFIRLTGCNLRCSYCDSAYAFKGGRRMSIPQVLDTIAPYNVRHVLLTGGEPLLQRPTPLLLQSLVRAGYEVSIETHGEVSIERVVGDARIVMDIKTPDSGMHRRGYEKNLPLLKSSDEIKFVICSEADYIWARDWVNSHPTTKQAILFSPVVAALGSPGKVPGIQLKWLAEKIIEDQLPVRMQVQQHKYIWGADTKGV